MVKRKEGRKIESNKQNIPYPVQYPVIREQQPYRIPKFFTDIPGFDELVPEGIPKKSTILLVGGSGSGKTIFAIQFLFNSLQKYNEPCLFVSFEEDEESIRLTSDLFGWNLRDLERKKLLKLVWKDVFQEKDLSHFLSKEFFDSLEKPKIQKIVFDSASIFSLFSEDSRKLRMDLCLLSRKLKEMGITTIFTYEIPEGECSLNNLEFISDGIIYLHHFISGDRRVRAIEIMKMRKTMHDSVLRPYRITRNGIKIFSHEQVMKQ